VGPRGEPGFPPRSYEIVRLPLDQGESAAAWREWAVSAAGPELAAEAEALALGLLSFGASSDEAAAAVRVFLGRSTPAELYQNTTQVADLEAALRALERARPGQALTEAALVELRSQLQTRAALLRRRAPSVAAPTRAAAPRPSLREFLATRSIQILAFSGAFLLAVATLLFDLTGSGPSRLVAVAALNLAFGLGAWVSFNRPALRVIAQPYLALAALLLPLTGLAAYVFLRLGSAGVSTWIALAIVASACALTYGGLALSVWSRTYAALATAASLVAVIAVLAWYDGGSYRGAPWLAAAAVAFTLAGRFAGRARPLFTLPAEIATYLAAAAGVAWALPTLFSFTGVASEHRQLTAALVAATAALSLHVALRSWRRLAWLPAGAASLSALSLAHDLGARDLGLGLVLVALGLAYIAAAAWGGFGPIVRAYGRWAAAVQLGLVVFASPSDPLHALLLYLAAAAGLLLALTSGPAWLFLAAGLASVGWFWLVKAVVPPPPSPGLDDLARSYSPLPVLFGVLAVAVRWRRGRRWAWPLYAAAGVLAFFVPAVAVSNQSWTLAGEALLVYAALAYGVALMERSLLATGVAIGAALLALGSLLGGANANAAAYVLTFAAAGTILYSGGRLLALASWSGRAADLQRAAGLAAAALAAAAGTVLLGAGGWDPVAGAFAALLGGVLLWVESASGGARLCWYLAFLTGSLAGVAGAKWLGLHDPQFKVLVPGAVLVALGVAAGTDPRLPERILLARLAAAAGIALLLGLTTYQAWGLGGVGQPTWTYTAWLAIESVILLAAGITGRSRVVVLGGGVGLVMAALVAATLLAEVIALATIFYIVAGALLVGATAAALLRSRFGVASDNVKTSWESWL
jgi:hypothetical protein